MNTESGPDALEQKSPSSIRTMNSVLSTLRVFEEVATRQPIGVSEIARITQIPKSSVQRCLVTLQQAGWLKVVDEERARWGVTTKALILGLRGSGEQDLSEVAGPVVRRLAAETGETVFLALRDGDQCVMVARADSTHEVRVFLEVGTRLPLYATTSGVAIMARLEPTEINRVLLHKAEVAAGEPAPSDAELREEIKRTEDRGYALNMSAWYRPHVASIGAAVVSPSGRPIAAIVLSIPEMRYDSSQESALAHLVVAAAADINRLIATG
jgi:IclR family acetate operon transcriptional repressor